MKETNMIKVKRRDLLTRIMPVCAASCLLPVKAFEVIETEKNDTAQQTKGMFENEIAKKLTYKELRHEQYKNLIWFARSMADEIGKEKTIELLKTEASKRNRIVSRRTYANSLDRSLKTYTRDYCDKDKWENLAKIEVIKDTDTVFEMKVHECIFATVFRERNAPEIGYAYFCWGDFAHVEEFNPKIKFIRDKTLMEGHDCCNHRYVMT